MFYIKTYYNCIFHTLNSAFDEKRKALIVWKEELKEALGWISAQWLDSLFKEGWRFILFHFLL